MSLMKFFSEKRVMSDIKNICDRARWMTTPKITEAAQYMTDRLKTISGLKGVEIIEFPADGKTAFGGWVMPKAWDVKSATLTLADGKDVGDCPNVLADYCENPFSLMLWSPPTPKAGVKAEVIIIDTPLVPRTDLSLAKGKFVLVGNGGHVGTATVVALAKAGAVGLITDCVIPRKESKKGPYLDEATQWWNYVNPQWDGEARLPAFALTPNVGRKLRALIAARGTVKLHAKVDSRLYDGTLPFVTAFLPGKRHDEIVLTAHMDEPGASDNASGTALSMEILRALAEYVAARKEPLEFGIRFFSSVEARGLQAYLNTTQYGRSKGNASKVVACLNLDMLAYDHTVGRTQFGMLAALPVAPSMIEFLMQDEAIKESKSKPAFDWKFSRGLAVDDCHFSGYPYSAPTLLLVQEPDKTYHCSLDTVDNLSTPHVRRMGRIVLDTLTPMLKPELKVLEKIGKRVLARAQAELQNPKSNRAVGVIIAETEKIWRDMLQCLSVSPLPMNSEELKKRRKTLLHGYVLPHYVFEAQVGEWSRVLRKTKAVTRPASAVVVPQIPAALAKVARSLVPLKLFAGYFSFEYLNPSANAARRNELKDRTGQEPSWSVAGWLQWSLDLANGKRTLLELYETVSPDHKVELKSFIETYRFLQEEGYVRFRPVVTKKELQAAIQKVEIKRGDIVMVHSSLSDFGYIEGGAEALIDSLIKIVGPKGTVCMPTHSLNWVGKNPYDPKTAPSFTGAVPSFFLKHKGILRSAHPTHSVAVFGPAAKALIANDGPHLAPQSREGFWGKFTDAGGKVLMLCKLGSNTLLHGAEIWAGTPYRPGVTHVLKKGKREEFVTPGMPWHVHAFVPVHASLLQKKLLHETALGESVIHAMNAQDAVAEMMQYVKENPLAPIREKCPCIFCEHMRKELGVELLKK